MFQVLVILVTCLMEQMILIKILGWDISSTDSTDNMFNDAIALQILFSLFQTVWINLVKVLSK